MASAEHVHLHRGDLPAGLFASGSVAIDTETMGLSLARDRLCLVQLSAGDGIAHLVKFERGEIRAPNLRALLANPSVLKIFHFGRFDLAMLQRSLGVETRPVFCTKIASRLCRTYSDRHGLKELTKDLLGIEISKQQQLSDWGAAELTREQQIYAADDVLYLHELKARLEAMLEREGRQALARACFDFLPARAALDLAGWGEEDIFAHS
ncbi:MAG: ribonuclease D [Alphaproteobacteria bacterium]|nr:ribonuclease D [Alphaproteobacteria bacterium]